MKRLFVVGLFAAFPFFAQAQTAPAKPCAAAEHRQFDFWIGEWDVFGPAGKQVGQSRVELHGGGCYLLENWSSTNGVDGKSLNMYDATDKRWHQAWYDSSGSRLDISGSFVDGKMTLISADGTQRVIWTPNADGSVRQLWEASKDQGKTWAPSFDGKYVKRKPH
ncbi:MAG: hypothetical protein ACJ8GW_03815 [Massilia sp.]